MGRIDAELHRARIAGPGIPGRRCRPFTQAGELVQVLGRLHPDQRIVPRWAPRHRHPAVFGNRRLIMLDYTPARRPIQARLSSRGYNRDLSRDWFKPISNATTLENLTLEAKQ